MQGFCNNQSGYTSASQQHTDLLIGNYLLTKSDVFARKSQTETLLLLTEQQRGQYDRTKVWDFPPKKEHSRLISNVAFYVAFALFLQAHDQPMGNTGE